MQGAGSELPGAAPRPARIVAGDPSVLRRLWVWFLHEPGEDPPVPPWLRWVLVAVAVAAAGGTAGLAFVGFIVMFGLPVHLPRFPLPFAPFAGTAGLLRVVLPFGPYPVAAMVLGLAVALARPSRPMAVYAVRAAVLLGGVWLAWQCLRVG